MAVLDNVPDEIIRHILQYVSPTEAYQTVPLVSKRLQRVANESLLWKYYCQISYRYWNTEHRFREKLEARASRTAWRDLWRRRRYRNDLIAGLLNDIIATTVGRRERVGRICQYGYDAKDFLLEQSRADDSVGDGLARRYYANMALSSIHRSAAVEEWYRYQRAPLSTQGLDRALAAFDMFFIRGDDGDIDGTCALLDQIATDFLQAPDHESFPEWSPRDKALALIRWVRDKNLTGMDNPAENYRCLRNCLLGHALRDKGSHPSLPIISCAIYTCLAERVGLRAACCAFPAHVHAMIMAPLGQDLNGNTMDPPSIDVDRMFLDPYNSAEEIQLNDLRSRLVQLPWLAGPETFLVPASVPMLVQRVGENMKASFHGFLRGRQEHQSVEHLAIIRDDRPPTKRNVESAAYAAYWESLLTTPVSNFQWDHTLDEFLHYVTHLFSEDAWLVEKYVMPLYTVFTQSVHPRHRFTLENVPEVLRLLRNADHRQPTVSRRYTQEIHQNVWYTVGQVFRHRRYGYVGIINGWGEKGTSSLPSSHALSMEEVMGEVMGDEEDSGTDSDTLRARLRKKVFYTCLTLKHDRSVVSQDAIDIIYEPKVIPAALMDIAGKFFLRFDRSRCIFVSNIKEYFPDD